MNYYPNNYYLNYPYGNQYQPQQPNMPVQAPQQPVSNLNGKIVDSADVVRATEVPIGGYGIFPKADLSEIYIKSWNNNGTTSIITFKPETPQEVVKEDNSIQEQLKKLEEKIDAISAAMAKPKAPVNMTAASKEVKF